jgi:hypothetical protein
VTTANTHNAGAVAHDEQLATVSDQAFFSNSAEAIVPKNELKSKLKLNFSTTSDYSGQKNIHNKNSTTFETSLKTDQFCLL